MMPGRRAQQDWADRIGKRISTILIAALIALFAYGYLGSDSFPLARYSAAAGALWSVGNAISVGSAFGLRSRT